VKRPDVAILGGGLVGRCLAWRASLSGARVVLYDSASSRGTNSAAWVAAGMIAPTTEAIDADVQVTKMGNNSLQLWPQWLTELPIPVFYRDTGTLLLWHPEDAGEASRVQSMLATRQAQSCVQCLESSQIAEVEPELGNRFSQALYVPGEAQIDNPHGTGVV
jgi:glycine oxidase